MRFFPTAVNFYAKFYIPIHVQLFTTCTPCYKMLSTRFDKDITCEYAPWPWPWPWPWFIPYPTGIGADFMFLVPGQKAPRSVETSMESRVVSAGMSTIQPTTGSRERRKHHQWGNFLNFCHLELEWTHLTDDNEIVISYFLEASYADWERLNTVKTRSQTVARIADRILPHRRLSSN